MPKGAKFISVACDGRYLYVHSLAGLTKYGTGYASTTLGHVYMHKALYQTHSPWLACVGDKLFVRSPAIAPDCLLVLDASTLEEIGRVNPAMPGQSVPLHSDGSASAMFPEKSTKPGVVGSGGGGGGGGGGGTQGRRPEEAAMPLAQVRTAAPRALFFASRWFLTSLFSRFLTC